MDYLKYKTEEELYALAYTYAVKMFDVRSALGIELSTVGELTDLLFEMFKDKAKQDFKTDQLIDYNDEIVSIVELSDEQTVDITVSKDSLFYANNILTKNSIGLPQSLDFFIALVTNEELMEMGRQMMILLKTRFGNKQNAKSQLVGIDFDKMRYYDIESDTSSQVAAVVGKRTPDTVKKPMASGIPSDISWD
jgi:hypothetical protein